MWRHREMQTKQNKTCISCYSSQTCVLKVFIFSGKILARRGLCRLFWGEDRVGSEDRAAAQLPRTCQLWRRGLWAQPGGLITHNHIRFSFYLELLASGRRAQGLKSRFIFALTYQPVKQ